MSCPVIHWRGRRLELSTQVFDLYCLLDKANKYAANKKPRPDRPVSPLHCVTKICLFCTTDTIGTIDVIRGVGRSTVVMCDESVLKSEINEPSCVLWYSLYKCAGQQNGDKICY